jgi:dynein heavy chain, axonemal
LTGNYSKELEEDYDVYDAVDLVQRLVLANEAKCNDFKQNFSKFDYLWKRDLNKTLQEFLQAEGKVRHQQQVADVRSALL